MVLLHHRYADSGHGTDPERRIKPRKLSDHLHSLHPLVSLACKFCESDSGPLCSLCNAGIYSEGENRRWTDILQIPLSIVFTRFLDLFTAWFDFTDSSFALRLAVLTAAIILTGAGAALTVDMNLIANPGDGFVQAVSMRFGKDLGTAKNLVDISCVIVSTLIGFAAAGRLVGVGLGTLIAMIGVGRVIALFNHLFQEKLKRQAVHG